MTDSAAAIEPLVKWPGGKRRLLPAILPFIPKTYGTYWEPFFGGGALFFALRPQHSVLSDGQTDLIEMYGQVQNHPIAVINQLQMLGNSEVEYYAVRGSRPSSAAGRAARLIYLCNLAFNGIHRVNKRGDFNVPYGHKQHIVFFDEARVKAASKLLRTARLISCDFESSLAGAVKGDLIYLDPPYTVAHGNNGFVKYNSKIFSWSDQERLALLAEKLRRKGCHVIISNADHPSIRDLYPNFSEHLIDRHSIMSASSSFRKRITESLFYSGVIHTC